MWGTEKSQRIKRLGGIAVGVIVFLIVRLGWLQLLQGPQYKKIAEENRIHQSIIQAPRGTMYDRNGAILVSNRPSFAISILPYEYTNPRDATPILSEITGVPTEQIETMLQQSEELMFTPIVIKRDVDDTMMARIEERKYYLPGVVIEAVPVRQYVYQQLAAHVFGYLGNISEAEYAKRREQGYRSNDLIGKEGLEREWEEVLRGVDGGSQVEVNALGEEIKIVGEKHAIAGKGLVLTLDANLQKVVEDALETQIIESRKVGEPAKGGSVVVLDVHTGGVLALASSPTFDPNAFASGISTREWNALINDKNNPLTNKVIQSSYPPASVFKIITTAAALDMGYTNTTEIFEDRGVYVLEGWSFYGWDTSGLGRLNIVDALTWSSDPVFYELGHRLGIDNLASYALTFGLGQVTGIKLQGEEKGLVPTEQWKMDTYGESWYPGETLIAAIGQGYYLVTPLQQALLLMAVANEGIVYRPMLVDKVLTPDGSMIEKYQPEVLRTIYLRPEIWETIHKGLISVTSKGTAASVMQGLSPAIAGKTGSAETGRGTTHSWFACYAPADKPEIVVTALVEDGGESGVAAGPIVRKVIEYYFSNKQAAAPTSPAENTN
ncbi:MAG TPA: penicillin-binding protein 2 [Negativicutes bacterium]|jgi:penicillin-binding protein 2